MQSKSRQDLWTLLGSGLVLLALITFASACPDLILAMLH